MRIQNNVFLSSLTTIGIGGRADAVLTPQEREFDAVYRRALEEYSRVIVLGNGSKVLCADNGFRGAVLKTNGLNRIVFDGTQVYAGAGVSLIKLAVLCAERGLSGLEWAIGIPASLGGAVTLNAGAYGGEIADLVIEVEGIGREFSAEECGFVYRGSAFDGERGVVKGVRLQLAEGDRSRIEARMREVRAKRMATQPIGARTAGSCFRRAEGVGAGRLIEEAGCKGRREGGAIVSLKHANFIENSGGATCQDVSKLLCYIQEEVWKKFSVRLVRDIIEVK